MILSYCAVRDRLTRAEIARALTAGRLIRVRFGWYATSDTPVEVLSAVEAGGSLTCGGALRHHGVWVMSPNTHVRLEPHARRFTRVAQVHRGSGVSEGGVDNVVTALRLAARCMSSEDLICALDSALNRGLVSPTEIALAFDSSRGRRIVSRVDGRSESGIETLARLRLRSRHVKLRPQVRIPGIGRVDLLIGDRLVLEIDGDAFHSDAAQREADRRRDSALVARGYLVMRAGYTRVIGDWAAFEREVFEVIRRGEHRWRAVHHVGAGAPRTR